MIEAQGWGVGAKVKVIRSGMVIPKIIATLEPVVPSLPDTCPSCQELLSWDANRVQLVCRQPSYCPAQQVQSAISFFNVLGIEEVGDKIVEQLYESGFNSIAKICSMSIEDFENLDRFASKRAKLIHDHIHAKLQNIELEKIQHASGCFKGLGSKRLALCNRFDAPDKKPELEAILSIDGFSDITARAYLKGFDLFWAFVQDLPITIRTPEAKSDNGTCQNYKFCFTGYRDKTAQAQIEKEGGEVGSSVTGKTTHVVAKDPSGSSSKLKKARDLGLPIWTPAELMEFLNS
jgi:NAD-dependent DNA ligase